MNATDAIFVLDAGGRRWSRWCLYISLAFSGRRH